MSLASVLCPCCKAPVDLDASSKERTCGYCGNRLLVSSTDPSRHSRSEIDPTYQDGCFGALTMVLHPYGTLVCQTCGLIYPSSIECCPGLIKFAINWYCESDSHHSESSRPRILDFIRSNQGSAILFISVQILESQIADECDIPVPTLLDIADAVGGELPNALKQYAR